jgi:hypothetical protein
MGEWWDAKQAAALAAERRVPVRSSLKPLAANMVTNNGLNQAHGEIYQLFGGELHVQPLTRIPQYLNIEVPSRIMTIDALSPDFDDLLTILEFARIS